MQILRGHPQSKEVVKTAHMRATFQKNSEVVVKTKCHSIGHYKIANKIKLIPTLLC